MPRKSDAEIRVPMTVDVDGAPNAYGPNDALALDYELNAHVGAKRSGLIVGYLTKNGDGRTPIRQGPGDPFPGFYISTSAYEDKNNKRIEDPRRYTNAAEINYTLLASVARQARVQLGDFCVVHSLRTGFTVYAIVGDAGHKSGAEGSLALLQRLGYKFKDGKADEEENANIVVRYFAGTNPGQLFFLHQSELEANARSLDLDRDFSDYHRGDPGKLVLTAVASTGPDLRLVRHAPFVPLRKKQRPPDYPGHLIQLDSADSDSIQIIQQRLRDLGFTQVGKKGAKPLMVDGVYGRKTADAVRLFQARHTDLHGRPLEVDGEVGSDTWGALFGRRAVYTSPRKPAGKAKGLIAEVLKTATAEIGVVEDPPASNRGKRVEEYLRSAGVPPGNAWCVAFVFFCFSTAAKTRRVKNPMAEADCRTGGVLDLWNRAQRARNVIVLPRTDALNDPERVKPGMIFIIDTGGGHGHAGLVTGVTGNRLDTIEGNTNDTGSRDGIGVFRHNGRTVGSINRGFLGFGFA
jgi:hypothetical protein